MGQAILPGKPPIEITLRRSARSRRLSLRVSRLDGRVTLSLPTWTADSEAMAFVREKESWIRRNLAHRPEETRPEMGGTVLFEGREVPIIAGAVRTARLLDGALVVPKAEHLVQARVGAFLKLSARTRLRAASDHYAGLLGRSYGTLTIRDTRSRWGSCSSEGNLMYSWRLIMAPPDVLDYVAAHEVAHLAEMNHSPAFWAVVARLLPDYVPHRGWLQTHGAKLHRYQFGD